MAIIAKDSTGVPHLLLTDTSGRILTVLTDGTTNVVVDDHTMSLVMIDAAHHEIHEGHTFHLSHFFSEVADDANADVHIIAGASKELHVTIEITGEGKAQIFLYEGTTYTGAGTAMTINDRNRTTAGASNATAKHTPIVNALGTERHASMISGGTGPHSIGATRPAAQEWIIKKSTDWLIRVTNIAGAAKDFSIEADYYEV